tara:strand:- start:2624 stop:2830 length:207 start_codon:yes stop_codon:yes gene_type:complete
MASKSRSTMNVSKLIAQNWVIILLIVGVLFVLNSGGICKAEHRLDKDAHIVYRDLKRDAHTIESDIGF